jgi:hypothetical protein
MMAFAALIGLQTTNNLLHSIAYALLRFSIENVVGDQINLGGILLNFLLRAISLCKKAVKSSRLLFCSDEAQPGRTDKF